MTDSQDKTTSNSDPKATNITWHKGAITPADRHKNLGQKGCTLWFTGLSGSGKSTVAVALEKALIKEGHHAYCLDGDNIRHGLNANLGFSPEDREENLRRIGEVAKLFADSGLITITSFISPYRSSRDQIRQLHEQVGIPFFEIHIHVPLGIAESRDPKGLYKKARAGEIKDFTGIHQQFEAPESPDLFLPTHELKLHQSITKLIDLLKQNNILTP
ncbi:Adenylyl-sulfate kinase [Poriferisphaera corsica]|uniref:Adenylyl-sulfate kinase n=1 Tax=Poriferisphaera corsica TaxID=2528020 RepID=A0A517YPI9_9BACT|nr:adenylyl-sulfate kinase [Poriferisphaera corsica]QDU32122.1 Adenylyl-sulfate kinase [Poriferisphaera corsica]